MHLPVAVRRLAPELRRLIRVRPILLFLLFAAVSADCLVAIEPTHHITQYVHTAWRIQDGFLNGIPTAITQTLDGYIWIGTQSGLMRFDGVRFLPWDPPNGEHLLSTRIDALVGDRDGSLWIGTAGGLSHWQNNHLVNFADNPGVVPEILQSRNGTIWIAITPAKTGFGPLCEIVGTRMRCHDENEGIPSGVYFSLSEDKDGTLWLGGDTKLVGWRNDWHRVYEPGGLKSNGGMSGFASLASGSDGTLWAGIGVAGKGLGLQRFSHEEWKPFTADKFDGTSLTIQGLLLDRENALWVGTVKNGIYRIYNGTVEHFDSKDGLSSDYVHKFFEDHEGNLWAVTSKGIDKFHSTPVVSFSPREGLGTTEVDSVLASRDGSVWIGGSKSLDVLRDGHVTSLMSGKGLPGDQVTSLFEDSARRLWMGIDDKLMVYEKGKFQIIHRPEGTPVGMVFGITEDLAGDIWIEARGKPGPLMRIRDFKMVELLSPPEIPGGRRIAPNPEGGIWLGLRNGDLARYREGKLETFPFRRPYDQRGVEQITVTSDGSVLGATAFGLIGWRQGKQLTLTTRNGLPCDTVYAFVFDDPGNLWLNTQCGIVEIAADSLQQWWENSEAVLQPRVFDVYDGALPGRAPFVSAAKSADGRVWFADGVALQMVDPHRITRNQVPPPVHIEGIVADRKTYSPQDGLLLPPLTRDLQIDYTALSFVTPQKVRFRYRLEGRDSAWEEPGSRRQAFYTDLRPGKYTFRVVACNNDGVWNEEGATLEFRVATAWYQTNWFRILAIIGVAVLAWLIYTLRVRQISAAISARFDDRLAERTRLAREFHDTLLQTIQGSKMVADNALEESPNLPSMRHAMERLSDWLGQATQEGRAALNSLRASTTETNDLAESFRRALEDCRMQGFPETVFEVDGNATDMHPIVRDEIYRIGYEAIRNACQHSKASLLQVKLTYSADLLLSISDNGAGMAPDVLTGGKEGHFGLQGMRERASRIGSDLNIASSEAFGTRIDLKVPGHLIFNRPKPLWLTLYGRIKRIPGGPYRNGDPN